jgi:D-alanyl-D-alanine carboxypeptidase
MVKKAAFSALLIASSISFASAQQFNKAKMDSLMNAIATNNQGMGSLALMKNGKIVYTRAIGYRNIEGDNKTAADYATKYRIGSISKMFTATMIFQLIDEHKLALDTKLSTFYPKVPNAKLITISDMLSHRSGIFNFTNNSEYMLWNATPHTHEQMLDIIIKGGSSFKPGAKADYSNANYVLLGYIIEKITGHTYKEELEKRIASKAGLANTYYGGKTEPAKNEAYSYSLTGDKWEKATETDMSIPGGAGAVLSTPSDLDLFITSLFTGKLISKKSLDEMLTIKDHYGRGIFEIPFGSKKGYGHTGGIDGFSSSLGYFPADSLAIAYISNGQVMTTNDIMIGALSIYFNEPYKVPDFKSVDVPENVLKSYTGVYSSPTLPLKITITMNGKKLQAQATGQSSLLLTATSETTFEFTAAGIVMIFNAEKNTMELRQGGGVYDFTKDK